jgi:hypothetical protein
MKEPIWKIFIDGTDTEVLWITHKPNPRFAIYTASPDTSNDDLVLDKETGLIWPRNPSGVAGTAPFSWLDANTRCRELKIVNRIGWRLPTVEELSSLVDTKPHAPTVPALPAGHPFLGTKFGPGIDPYWTSTNSENPAGGGSAWFVEFGVGGAGLGGKGNMGYAWPVRGGRGGVNWNW